MTYEAETTELKAEFDGDFDTDDEFTASHFPFTDSCLHSCYLC
ncbi:MAG: hypothetical protein J07HB67_01578 [halophilic archaeon J07HB67]|jgi:hypothetical protein|nr:MAG: hypothetical protein J07HB67_01578 [halophilic archaeon J07HB67]